MNKFVKLSDLTKLNQLRAFDTDWSEYDEELVRLFRLTKPDSNAERLMIPMLLDRSIVPTRIQLKRLAKLFVQLQAKRVAIEMNYFEKGSSMNQKSACVAGWAFFKNQTFKRLVNEYGWYEAIERYYLNGTKQNNLSAFNWIFGWEWDRVVLDKTERKTHAIARIEYCIDNPVRPIPEWFVSPTENVEKYFQTINPYI